MSIFIPTFLYIKQHTITGKLYFGKTTKSPEIYLGSGTYWLCHIKKHGKEYVVNVWYCLFLSEQECTDFALSFSKNQNIVESAAWANQMEEDGLNGWPTSSSNPIHSQDKTKLKDQRHRGGMTSLQNKLGCHSLSYDELKEIGTNRANINMSEKKGIFSDDYISIMPEVNSKCGKGNKGRKYYNDGVFCYVYTQKQQNILPFELFIEQNSQFLPGKPFGMKISKR